MTNVVFLGHCYEPNKHDKIWGFIRSGDQGALTFWGRRCGTLSFKYYASIIDAMDQRRTKEKKYQRIADPRDYSSFLPDDFEAQVMLARLGQIKFS